MQMRIVIWGLGTLRTNLMALAILALVGMACAGSGGNSGEDGDRANNAQHGATAVAHDPLPGEKHLSNIRQLTFAGENAEAYFSFDSKHLIYQATFDTYECDQIFTMQLDGSQRRLASTGRGRTTCSYFFPGDNRIIYASTHGGDDACPQVPDHSQGYVWPIYATYDLYTARPDGSDLVALTEEPGYDAEATVGPDGTIVFTSTRDGDLELYSMAADGSNVRRLTHEIGYDGGAFFSADGSKIVYRAQHPTEPEALADYQRLLAANLVRPGKLEIFVMDADGSNKRQVTNHGAASFCPFFHPSGEKIIFASNLHNPEGRNFDLFLIGVDGSDLERITFDESFDGFPMFSPDGKRLAFGSNRATPPGSRDTHVFIADWND